MIEIFCRTGSESSQQLFGPKLETLYGMLYIQGDFCQLYVHIDVIGHLCLASLGYHIFCRKF